jgi:hypothetical protein
LRVDPFGERSEAEKIPTFAKTKIAKDGLGQEMDASKYFSPAPGIADLRRYGCGICFIGVNGMTD